jgi:hypothetical protein
VEIQRQYEFAVVEFHPRMREQLRIQRKSLRGNDHAGVVYILRSVVAVDLVQYKTEGMYDEKFLTGD